MEWGDGLQLQELHWGRRLACSTNRDPIEFLSHLVRGYPGPFWIKFILEDNTGAEDIPVGRYQSTYDLTYEQCMFFLNEFADYLRSDGRHLLMVCSDQRTVVFDQHDYFYVYGDIESLTVDLQAAGHVETDYVLGEHMHLMSQDVAPLRRLLGFWQWHWAPLEATDTSPDRVGRLRWARMKLRAWRYDWRERMRRPSH